MSIFDSIPTEDSILVDIVDDMYCGSLSAEVVGNFTCMLCYGIVHEPLMCNRCSNLVCGRCINQARYKQGNL